MLDAYGLLEDGLKDCDNQCPLRFRWVKDQIRDCYCCLIYFDLVVVFTNTSDLMTKGGKGLKNLIKTSEDK